ncbi:MAG: 5'-3' exonuclease H3TH domain-containing protein, partial [Huintestinicola sp.]
MKLLAIDGNSIMNRAFYGIKALSNKKGVFTNAITGFMNIYLKVKGDISPDGCAVAFDLREPTFRHKANAAYKANRHGMPDELAMQMPLIKDILRSMGVTVLECAGYEADDILGSLAALCGEQDEAYILTGDRDSLQLIRKNVTVLLHTTKELISCTPEKFSELYDGLEPLQIIDLKGLMGDSSDNISGVKGIGEKTAKGLIKDYHSIEELYEKLEKGEVKSTPSVLTKLAAGKEDAKESKWLATIVTDAPVSKELSDYRYGEGDKNALSVLLTELEMTKLMEKLEVKPSAAPNKVKTADAEKEYVFEGTTSSDITGDFGFIYTEKGLYAVCGEKLVFTDNEDEILS